MQTRIARSLLFVAFLAATGALQAEPGFDPGARAKAIAPFIDEQTVGVVHVDIARIRVDPLFDKLREVVPEASIEDEEVRARAKQVRDGLVNAGARELYVVVSLADAPRDPAFVIVPLAEGAKVDAIKAILPPMGRDGVVERLDGALFAGPRRTLERVKAATPDARSELVPAFKAAGDTAAQFLLLPPPHARRVITELMPTLPKEVGGGPSTILTNGLLWVALSVDAPPKMSLRMVVQSQDEAAAAALRAKWLEFVEFLSTREEARKMLRDFEEAAALMTPTVEGNRLVLNLSEQDRSIAPLLAAITPPFEAARAAAKRSQSCNNLKQLAIAMHNYHDTWKKFPAIGNADGSGNMLLSWRVHILPYLEQVKLYKQFRLDEPWDSTHNRKLIEKMPEVYRCPASGLKAKQGLSTYRVLSGEETVFPGREGLPMKEIKDGTSNTIMIVEVADENAALWTKPEGFPFDPVNPATGLGGQFEGGFDAAFCDGSVRFISETVDRKTLRALFTRAGGEAVSDY